MARRRKKSSGCLPKVIGFFVFIGLLGSCFGGGAESTDQTEASTIPAPETTIAATTQATFPLETEVEETFAETVAATESLIITEPQEPVPTQPIQQEPQETMVWIPTGGGSRYHSRSGCSGMDNPDYVTISQAEARGFTPCGRCY